MVTQRGCGFFSITCAGAASTASPLQTHRLLPCGDDGVESRAPTVFGGRPRIVGGTTGQCGVGVGAATRDSRDRGAMADRRGRHAIALNVTVCAGRAHAALVSGGLAQFMCTVECADAEGMEEAAGAPLLISTSRLLSC